MKEYNKMIKTIGGIGLGIAIGVDLISEMAPVNSRLCITSICVGLGIFAVTKIIEKIWSRRNKNK